ncbi:MAG: 4-(cytidine 5'-diphospho)-2-C-methyl-D-erythritol kinase [Planctomycetota bacterium]
MTARSLTLDAPAKLNLALAVGPPDPDDPLSRHPIASWMVALDFGDRVTLTALDDDASPSFDVRFADDAPAPRDVDWPLDDDLAVRAHAAVVAHIGRPLPVRLAVEKRVPPGAGLGGGSADAAATLAGLDRLFGLGLGEPGLEPLARRLGSDVSFALGQHFGRDAAVVSGFGEQQQPLPVRPPLHFALILPTFGCPTGAVYHAIDRLPPTRTHVSTDDVQALAAADPLGPDDLFNDLTPAAVAVRPELGDLLARLTQTLGRPVHVTGSGSACFVVCGSAQDARDTATLIHDTLDVPALPTRSRP